MQFDVCVIALPPVENLTVWTHSGQLLLAWRPPNITAGRNATEYVVEWVSGMQMDWQREHGNARQSAIKGTLKHQDNNRKHKFKVIDLVIQV